jgi:hypothetical protein
MRPGACASARTLAALDCFIVAGLLGVYLKLALLGPHWGAIARFLGRTTPADVTFAVRLGFFFHDIWLNLLAIPIAGTVIVGLLFRRHCVLAAFVTSAVMSVLYFVELQVQREVGEYLSRDVVRDLLGWTFSGSGAGLEYVTLSSVLKLAAVLATLFAIVVVERLESRAERLQRARRAWWYRSALSVPAVIVMLAAVVSSPFALASRSPASPLSGSSIGRAAGLLLRVDRGITAGADTREETLAIFRRLTHSANAATGSAYVGGERDSDVILFMMETGAARALDLAVSGRGLPGVGQLYARAFVASRHYTTHPYSSDALYSVFSGRYPQGRRRLLRAVPNGALDGLMTNVRETMPVRRVYVPSLYEIELDDRMYQALGAESIYASDHVDDAHRAAAVRRADAAIESLEKSGSRTDPRVLARLLIRMRADLQALEKLKADITTAIGAGRHFMVMFFPEIGHGPWPALHGEASVLGRGRALMLLQDAWLAEIIDLLRQLGRLEHTVIVVSADHGVRTKAEDPSLPIGAISDYMFRVPLLVYAPQTLTSAVPIDHPTSHIDVAPTLLALLGATRGLARMQGVPIWQRARQDRIYLLAFDYGGAEGFVEDGRYFMRQGLSGAVYASDRFQFDDADQVREGDDVARYVDEGLKNLDAVQQALVSRTLAQLGR